MRRAKIIGVGHERGGDADAGYTPDDQEALPGYLLSLEFGGSPEPGVAP
jgi:hypothetical protein